jgi:hypothetical protein
MKGFVFTSFLELVEEKFGITTVDAIITQSGASGVYTSVGVYPHSEMVDLIVALSEKTGISVSDLQKVYGQYLFEGLTRMHPYLMENQHTSFGFLQLLDGYIHVEVRKLHDKVDLPSFKAQQVSDNCLVLTYRSERKMADLAEGLIEGCGQYFGEKLSISRKMLQPDGTEVAFTIFREES